jgi:hypothetical protein
MHALMVIKKVSQWRSNLFGQKLKKNILQNRYGIEIYFLIKIIKSGSTFRGIIFDKHMNMNELSQNIETKKFSSNRKFKYLWEYCMYTNITVNWHVIYITIIHIFCSYRTKINNYQNCMHI